MPRLRPPRTAGGTPFSPMTPHLLRFAALACLVGGNLVATERIRPWPKNPWFWEYQGKPVMLLGGSKDDSLFQIPDLKEHLDAMAKAGANYIRNTMSDRRDFGFEVYPFKQLADGRYDLAEWNPEYWQRFDNLLRWTHERGIVVQIEVWDRFDYSTDKWPPHPYNPKNNVNYTYEESGFAPEYPEHPGRNRQPFFFTTPLQKTNTVVLRHQQRFVEEMLRRSLHWPHVLYCIDNETSGEEAWAIYWAGFIHERAKAAGVQVMLTQMWDAHDLKSPQHRRTFDYPQRFAFVDISQNNHQNGDAHWMNFQWARTHLASQPRPMNTVKVYGADGSRHGPTDRHGLERWWRTLLAGAASVRFHRPTSGLGFSAKAEATLRSARMVESRVKFWDVVPALERLRAREPNEAFAAAQPGRALIVYFTDGGEVEADLRDFPAGCEARWVDIERAEWKTTQPVRGGDWLSLSAPAKGHWAVVIQPRG
jgi:hypothetical protein